MPDGLGERLRQLELARQLLAAVAPCRHGPGFGCCWWWGTYYTFSAAQARVVGILWDAWLNDTPDVRQEVLLEAVGCESRRLDNLFRNHPAWGAMIVQGAAKGLYRLNDPTQSTNNPVFHAQQSNGARPGG